MRNIMRLPIGLLLTIALFTACENPFTRPVKSNSIPEGFGKVSVNLGAEGGRTIYPDKIFARYTYTFTPQGGAPVDKTLDNSGAFTLAAGSWTVTVRAFNGGETPAASGTSEPFTIAAGQSIQVKVSLIAQGDGNGSFAYNIRYPSGTTVSSFTLERLSDNTPVTLNPTVESAGITGDLPSIPSGFYLLTVSLSNGGLTSGAAEVIIISPGLTTHYGTPREPVIFGDSYFTPSEEGIYVGFITFAGAIENSVYQTPILLNSVGRDNLISNINGSYNIAAQQGTALYYGVHKGLENLKSRETAYPSNLMSVNLITFTDGTDNASASRSLVAPLEGLEPFSADGYSTFVKEEISSRRIAGKPITAYSIGVQGEDVRDDDAFLTSIKNLSSPGKYYDLSDFTQVQQIFDGIANGLVIEGESKTTFNLITTLLENGTKVRMTFDPIGTDSASAAASTRYIEGTINTTGSGESVAFTLNGISSSAGIVTGVQGGSLAGIRDGSEVLFPFDNITGYEQEYQANVKQWTMASGATTWHYEPEFDSSGATVVKREKHSTVIYLVMDASTSLSTEQIGDMRTAARNFINSLYNRYNSRQDASALVNGVWANGIISTSYETHQYTFNVTAGTQYNVWWNDRDGESSAGRTMDVDVSAVHSDGTSYFISDSNYSTPQRFTPTSSGTVTLRVRSLNGGGGTGTYAVVYATGSSPSRPAYTPPGNVASPDAVWPIEEDIWINGNLKTGATDRYSFNVESGKTYHVWWNSNSYGDSNKNGNISVSAQYQNGGSLFSGAQNGWSTAHTFESTVTGTVNVSVRGYYSDSAGTYAIGYTSGGFPVIRPETVIQPLAGNELWEDGNLLNSGQVDWYSIDVTEGNSYYVWWNDYYGNLTANGARITVSGLYQNGETAFPNYSYTGDGWTTPKTITSNRTGKVYVKVSVNSSYTGTYEIGFVTETNFLRPGTDVQPLTVNEWKNGTLSTGQDHWYSFNINPGYDYYIWWNDSKDGNSTKNADVRVSGQYQNGAAEFGATDNGWSAAQMFPFTGSAGKFYVKVNGVIAGEYAVVYSIDQTERP